MKDVAVIYFPFIYYTFYLPPPSPAIIRSYGHLHLFAIVAPLLYFEIIINSAESKKKQVDFHLSRHYMFGKYLHCLQE